jgi:V8-like Glu-specific endopeptidase
MKTTRMILATVLASVSVLYLPADVTQAQQSGPVTLALSGVEAQATLAYWTPERLASAQPMPLPRPAFTPETAPEPQLARTPQWSNGRAPTLNVRPDLTNLLYDPATAQIEPEVASEEGVEPQNHGTLLAPYTSSRIVPTTADTVYPYRAAGKFFFTQPGVGNFVCSAGVISRRVIATAGHCVHSGVPGGFYTNFLFVPAFRNGAAPFQSWNWAFVIVTGTWAAGGGGVPNAADYAMLEVQDRVVGGVLRRLGDVTGWFGWQTLSLSRNHTTKLGYPVNLDNGQMMHQELSGNFRNTSPNNVEYGSHSRGGSSGGPWVQNFGAAAAGQVGGLNTGLNRVVGVTSYGYISTDPKVQGASILDSRWVSLWNSVCAHRVGNCS